MSQVLKKINIKLRAFGRLSTGDKLTIVGLILLLFTLPILVGVALQKVDSRFSKAQIPATPVTPPTTVTPTSYNTNTNVRALLFEDTNKNLIKEPNEQLASTSATIWVCRLDSNNYACDTRYPTLEGVIRNASSVIIPNVIPGNNDVWISTLSDSNWYAPYSAPNRTVNLVANAQNDVYLPLSHTAYPPYPTRVPPTPTPTVTPGNNPINWTTQQVHLTADNFYIVIDGKTYYGHTADFYVHSDPGSSIYTTLEANWHENGVEMRLFMYFRSDGINWWMYEMRTYNGRSPGDWITFYYPVRSRPLSSPLIGNYDWWATEYETGNISQVHMSNMSLLPFWNSVVPSVTPTPIQTQATIEFRPTSGAYNVGDTINTGIYFNTKNVVIGGVAVRASYPISPNNEVVPTSITVNPDFGASGNWACPTQNSQIIGGRVVIDIACANLTASGFATNSAFLLSNINLQINNVPIYPLNLTFDASHSVVTRKSDGQNILAYPLATASYTIAGPTPTPDCNFAGDANCDQRVDILDYSILFASFGKAPGSSGYDPRANLNHSSDGLVDILDYAVLFYNFGNVR